jgi:hypothetical protein
VDQVFWGPAWRSFRCRFHPDPWHSWYDGFDWWHGKFAKVIDQLADEWKVAVPLIE